MTYVDLVSGRNHARLLYHYTSLSQLPAILASGQLATSSSPSAGRVRASARVVWLTDDAQPGSGLDHGLGTGVDPQLDKRVVRFTVAVSFAQHWPEWARRRKVSRRTLRALDSGGGGLSERWWVVTQPIPASDWAMVENRQTGEVIWPRTGVRGLDASALDPSATLWRNLNVAVGTTTAFHR